MGTYGAGGFSGHNDSSCSDSFWDTETSGYGSNGYGSTVGITGKTTAEMLDQSTFTDANWDFIYETANGTNDHWGINGTDNSGYPFLTWQGYISVPDALDSPQNIVISVVETSIEISWDEVIGANSYKIYSADTPDGTFTDISNSGTFVGESWSAAITETKKFYYLTGSTDSGEGRISSSKRRETGAIGNLPK